jgi:DNA repair protein RadC
MKQAQANPVPVVTDRFGGLSPSGLNAQEKQSVVTLATKVLALKFRTGCVLRSPEETRTFLRLRLAERRNEVFGCIFLSTRHRIIAVSELFQGTIDGASVYPRVVVQKAIENNAGSVIFFHNHPSSVAEPSHADELITRRLKDALALIDVRVLDHFVVSAGETVSFAQSGLL